MKKKYHQVPDKNETSLRHEDEEEEEREERVFYKPKNKTKKSNVYKLFNDDEEPKGRRKNPSRSPNTGYNKRVDDQRYDLLENYKS